jgi:hypothetical protein
MEAFSVSDSRNCFASLPHRDLLEQQGYMHASAVQCDDWYVHNSIAAPLLEARLQRSLQGMQQ